MDLSENQRRWVKSDRLLVQRCIAAMIKLLTGDLATSTLAP
jgi:hypothetical protein